MKRWPGTLLLAAASCAGSWGVFEFLGGFVLRRALGDEYATDVDHRLKPSRRRGINRDGIRSTREADEFADASFNVVFLGDSYTYGVFVQSQEAFPALVEGLLDKRWPGAAVKVANFGWPSSSPLLSLRLLRDIGARYRPDLVVLCLDMTDFHDDLRYEGLLQHARRRLSPTSFLLRRTGLDKVLGATRAVVGFDRSAPGDRFFALKQPLASSRPLLRSTEEHVGAIARAARQSLRADFLLVLLPRPVQYNAAECPDNWERGEYDAGGAYVRVPFEWLRELEARVDYPAASLLPAFEASGEFPTAFRHDPHWNPAGHRVAARALASVIVDLVGRGRLRTPTGVLRAN